MANEITVRLKCTREEVCRMLENKGFRMVDKYLLEDNEEFNTADKLKQKLMALHLPIDESDFFVKKAEERLRNILGRE